MSTLGQHYRWSVTEPCGTEAAYRNHYRHGEKPCFLCRLRRSHRVQDQRDTATAARDDLPAPVIPIDRNETCT